jgi:hypothetical protein
MDLMQKIIDEIRSQEGLRSFNEIDSYCGNTITGRYKARNFTVSFENSRKITGEKLPSGMIEIRMYPHLKRDFYHELISKKDANKTFFVTEKIKELFYKGDIQ